MTLTHREKEVLKLIQANPMISQEELSNIVGISRSAVAGHIASLVKKGFILGRGYMVKGCRGVTVIGGANLDIKGKPYQTLKKYTSNPGHIDVASGGVGRNIAHNLALLNVPVTLLTVVGNDEEGRRLLEDTRKSGVNCEHIALSNAGHTGIYIAILNEAGDMDVAISGMDILEELNIKYLESKRDIIKNSGIVVIDTNIPRQSIGYLLDICNKEKIPVLAEPVSMEKSKKLKDVLGKIEYITPNREELESISGIAVKNDGDMMKAVEKIRNEGVNNVIVTLGERGIYMSCGEFGKFLDPYKCDTIDATGAGDAFTAGFVYGVFNDYSVELSAKLGLAAASLTVSSIYTVNPLLNEEALKNIVKVDENEQLH